MKIPLDNGNDDDGSRGPNAESDSGGRGEFAASGIESSGITGQSSAGSGALDLGSDLLPLGDGGYKKRSRKRKGDIGGSAGAGNDTLRIGGRGSNRGRGNRSETDSNSSSASARSRIVEETSPGDANFPREIAIDSLGKPKEKKDKFTPNESITTEFIAEGFGIIFHTFAILLNDDEWKLPQDDATELADRAKRWAKQGSKSAAAFEKKLAKYEPMMMLIFGLFAVLLPRIIHTRDKRRALSIQSKAASTPAANANGARSPTPVQGGNGANVGGNAERPQGTSESVIPFRRKDGAHIFDELDERTV